jgi:hypothetical protein
MALNLERLSADWRTQYGHPIVLVESFVDLEWFRGTAYKASGWQAVGLPAGWGAEERVIERRCPLDGEGLRSLWRVLHQEVPESRDVRGLRHRQATVLAITFAYLPSGARGVIGA